MSGIPIGTGAHVRITAPGSWFDGMSGVIVREEDIPNMVTVEIEEPPGQPRALVPRHELMLLRGVPGEGRAMSEYELLPAESIALTVARAQIARGENPEINVTTVLVMALDRLTADSDVPGEAGR